MSELFNSVKRSLSLGGLFLFTTEDLDSHFYKDRDDNCVGVKRLQDSARFAHSDEYVNLTYIH